MKNLFFFIGILLCASLSGQEKTLTGVIYEENKDGSLTPLPFVNVHWSETQIGTSSQDNGVFQIPYKKEYRFLVVSFVGYTSDTLEIRNNRDIDIVLKSLRVLDEVEIVYRRRGTEISLIDPIIALNLNKRELRKAACCNLAESFETNASIDASFTNAATGREQIKMLGLDGKYVQIMEDNIPYVRGLANYDGLEYIPGAWINSIQIAKAAGSVVNGFESMTGQINVNMKQPQNAEDLHINLYANGGSRLEANVNFNYDISDKFRGTFLAHAKDLSQRIDNNEDGFLDNPLSEHVLLQNNFKFQGEYIDAEFGLKGVYIANQSGQMEFSPENLITSFYGVLMDTKRVEAYSKTGYIFPNSDYASLGLQLKGVFHNQSGMYGRRNYTGEEQSVFANLIFQNAFSDKHKYKLGASFLWDYFDEGIEEDGRPLVAFVGSQFFRRTERVPGIFFEYSLDGKDIYNVITGLRLDQHNIYGTLINGRLNARYALDARTAIKIAAGKGQRVANIFNENLDFLASSRSFFIDNPGNGAFGLEIEEATTVGINFTQKFDFLGNEASVLLDFFNTNFLNQVVVDLDASAQHIRFYNLVGKSFSNSLQAELHFEPLKRFEMRLAGRWMDVQTEYAHGQLRVPYVPNLRGFLNLEYRTRKNKKGNRWMLDGTFQYIGEQRLPSTASNPVEFQRNHFSEAYPLLSFQFMRMLGNDLEFYLGMENALNFIQTDAIISANDPFGTYFDSNFAFAPVFGRNIYLGLRFSIFRDLEDLEGTH